MKILSNSIAITLFFLSDSFTLITSKSTKTTTTAFSPTFKRRSKTTTISTISETQSTSKLSASTTSSSAVSGVFDDDFDWEAIAKDVFKTDKRPVILFDGVCKFCNGGVNFALDNDSVGSFRFASLQSAIGKSLLLRSGKTSNDMSSIVLVTETESYFKSDAVLRISSKLDGNPAFPILGSVGRIFPAFVKNTVYDFVSENRYKFGGETDQCRLDFGEFDDRFFDDDEPLPSSSSPTKE